jgi:preprotein translocase subunit SecG
MHLVSPNHPPAISYALRAGGIGGAGGEGRGHGIGGSGGSGQGPSFTYHTIAEHFTVNTYVLVYFSFFHGPEFALENLRSQKQEQESGQQGPISLFQKLMSGQISAGFRSATLICNRKSVSHGNPVLHGNLVL